MLRSAAALAALALLLSSCGATKTALTLPTVNGPGPESIFEDEALLHADPSRTLDTLKRLGVDRVRVSCRGIAGAGSDSRSQRATRCRRSGRLPGDKLGDLRHDRETRWRVGWAWTCCFRRRRRHGHRRRAPADGHAAYGGRRPPRVRPVHEGDRVALQRPLRSPGVVRATPPRQLLGAVERAELRQEPGAAGHQRSSCRPPPRCTAPGRLRMEGAAEYAPRRRHDPDRQLAARGVAPAGPRELRRRSRSCSPARCTASTRTTGSCAATRPGDRLPYDRAELGAFRSAHPGLFRASGYADHPYPISLAPNKPSAHDANYTEFSQLPDSPRR